MSNFMLKVLLINRLINNEIETIFSSVLHIKQNVFTKILKFIFKGLLINMLENMKSKLCLTMF